MDAEAVPVERPKSTVVAASSTERAVIWLVFPLLGAGAGWVVKLLAGWAASLPWFPFQGLLERLSEVSEPLATLVSIGVGAVAGLIIAAMAHDDYVRLIVTDADVTVEHGDSKRVLERRDIGSIFKDGKDVVFLGRSTDELLRQSGDLPEAASLEQAFLQHGYPWRSGGDPYTMDYRPWTEETTGLPAGADALLKVRAALVESRDGDGDAAKEAAEEAERLRRELAGLGVVVRDDNGRQLWRRTRPSRNLE